MKNLLQGLVIIFSLILVACVAPTPVQPPKVSSKLDARDINKWITSDEDRDIVLNKKIKTKECGNSEDCEEICEEIYNRRGDSDECKELSIKQVKRIEDIHEFLEDPDLEELTTIYPKDLDIYVNVSISALDTQTDSWNKSDSKTVLTWMALDADIAKIFYKEDKDYRLLKSLLLEIGSGSGSADTYLDALKDNLDGGTFIELSVEKNNEQALKMIHSFMEEQTVGKCSGDDLDTVKCLETYCEIAASMDKDLASDWLSIDYFENYIDGIIDDHVNGTSGGSQSEWDTRDIDSVHDLGDKWWDDLC